MKTLLHHSFGQHDFIANWSSGLDLLGLVKECEFDGFTWSSRQGRPPAAQPELYFLYTSLLTRDGFESAGKSLQLLAAEGIASIAVTDLSYCAYNLNSPFNPNERALNPEQRKKLMDGLKSFGQMAEDRGFTFSYRPHLGTSLQNLEDIEELAAQSDWPLILDTGHLVFLKMFSLADLLETYRSRLSGLIYQDYNPCAWVAARQNSDPLNVALATGLFKAPADLGIKLKTLKPYLKGLPYLIIAAERKPDVETRANLLSAMALLKTYRGN